MRRLWLILSLLAALPSVIAQQADSTGTLTFALGGVTFDMVPVVGGTFMMGTDIVDRRKPTYEAERPAHEVSVSGFYMSRHEVTQALWVAVMGDNPSQWTGNDSLPVEQVSWTSAQQFVTLLSQMLGYRFRLPSEAEWEYAARGGNSPQKSQPSSENLYEYAWYCANSGGHTHVVGQKQPNAIGLYDMAGNVSEWCYDWMSDYTVDPQTNPLGPKRGDSRILRGGNFNSPSYDCTPTDRSWYLPSSAYPYFGLRLVLESLEPIIED